MSKLSKLSKSKDKPRLNTKQLKFTSKTLNQPQLPKSFQCAKLYNYFITLLFTDIKLVI